MMSHPLTLKSWFRRIFDFSQTLFLYTGIVRFFNFDLDRENQIRQPWHSHFYWLF